MNTSTLLAASTVSGFYVAYLVCLILGIIFLLLAIMFFFVFKIPQVFLLKTGQGARQTIKRMKEENALSGKLRKPTNDYMLSQEATTAETKRTGRLHKSGKLNGAEATAQPAQPQPSEQAESENATTVLGNVETTILANNETVVLNTETTPDTETTDYSYTRTTSGKFEIVYDLMLIHSDEVI